MLAEPGDLILWDSRLIHGGREGERREEGREGSREEKREEKSEEEGEKNEEEGGKNELARCSVPVCMVPREWASKEVTLYICFYSKKKFLQFFNIQSVAGAVLQSASSLIS